MSRNKAITCPQCRQSDHVIKVSRLYILGLSNQYLQGKNKRLWTEHEEQQPDPDDPVLQLSRQEISSLSKHFSPPSGGSRRGEYLHPDWIVIAASLVALFFLYQVVLTNSLPDILIFVAIGILAYGAYFYFRKKLVARHRAKLEAQAEEVRLVEKAIGRWMKLYYCTHDQTVFDVTSRQVIPLDEFKYYLFDRRK